MWLSTVNGPALPTERCIQVDKAPPEKNESEKTHLTIEPHPQQTAGYWFILEKKALTIGYQDTNQRPTLYVDAAIRRAVPQGGAPFEVGANNPKSL